MCEPRAREAAETIWASWERGQRLQELPDSWRPRSLIEGYAAQAMLEEVSGSSSLGWKIAATNVTGPLVALAWLANNHGLRGCGLSASDIVTTGVCGVPSPIGEGDHVCADFGSLGRVALTLDAQDDN